MGLEGKAVSPFNVLSLEDAPDRHQLRSEKYAQKIFGRTLYHLGCPQINLKNSELDILVLTSEASVAYVIAKVIETHSRDDFEVFGYSLHGNYQDD